MKYQLRLVRVLGKVGNVKGINPLLNLLSGAKGDLKEAICDALIEIDYNLMKEDPIGSLLKTGYAWLRFYGKRAWNCW